MKRISVLLALIVSLAMFAHSASAAVFLGLKKASETISFPVIALDSAGQIVGKPDSIHILTYADNGTAAAFTTRSTTWPFSDISCDTLKIYGDTTLFFADQIQDIDGTAGNFQLAINVRTFFKKLRTDNVAIVQVLYDSLPVALASVAKAAADSTWGKAYGTSFTAGTMGDSLNNLSYVGGLTTAIQASVAKAAADSTWNKSFGTAFTAGTMGDSLNNESYVQNMSRVSMDATAADNLEAMLDGTGAKLSLTKLGIYAASGDTAFVAKGEGAGFGGAFIGGASAAYGLAGISPGASSAGIAGIGGTGASSAGIYGATSGGAGAGMKASGVTTGNGFQTTGGSTSGYGFTVTSVGTSAAFNIAASNVGMPGLSIEGSPGISTRGADGTGGAGFQAIGDSTGQGIYAASEQGDGMRLSAGTAGTYNVHGFRAVGKGTGHGIYAQGGASAGDGMNLEKGSGGQDLDADLGLKDSSYVGAADAINDSTIAATALVDSIWNEDSTGHYTSPNMAFTAAQTGSSTGLDSAATSRIIKRTVWGVATGSGADSTTAAQRVTGAAASVTGAVGSVTAAVTVGTINSGVITSTSIATDAIGADEIAASAIGASELAADAITSSEIADNAIDAGAIATDAVTATKIAADAFTSSELATSFMDEIVDGVWNEDTTGHYTSPHFGYLAVQTGSSTGLDSAATSRIIKRTVWGIGVGSGADSTTQAQRTVTASAVVDSNVVYRQAARAIKDSTIAATALVDSIWNEDSTAHFTSPNMAYVVTSMLDNTITAAKIATDAITSSKIAPDAIGASEIAADALSSSELAAAAAQEIADQVWDEDTTSHNITNSFGYFNNGRNWATVGQMVDSVWDEDSTGHYTSPNMAYIAALTAAGTGLNAADSSLIMRLIKRGWGIGVGSGSDSTTASQRTTGAAASVTGAVTVGTINSNVITATSIAADAITSSEIATDAIGASELAADAIGSSEIATDAITSTELAADAVGASEIATDALTATEIAADAIASSELAATAASEIEAAVWAAVSRTLTSGSYSGLTAADSGLVSRLIGRKGWGIAQGAGADSLTAAQRVISSTGSVTITGADIAAIAKASGDSTWQKNFTGAGSVAGSIGDSLNNSSYVGGGGGGDCTGNGAYTVTVRVVDTSAAPDSVLSNQLVTVNNAAQNGQTYTGITNNNGQIQFNLDAGTYVRLTDAAGYAFDVDTFTVAGTRTDSLKLYKNVGDRKPISFRLDDPSGAPLREFSVSLQLVMVNDSLPRLGDTALTANAGEVIRLTDLDRTGTINWHLLQNPRITNDSSYYVATFYRKNGSKLRGPEKFRVPTGTSVSEYWALTRWFN